MIMYADIEDLTREYMASIDSGVSKNFVNFSKVGDPDWQEWLNTISNPENIIDMNEG